MSIDEIKVLAMKYGLERDKEFFEGMEKRFEETGSVHIYLTNIEGAVFYSGEEF